MYLKIKSQIQILKRQSREIFVEMKLQNEKEGAEHRNICFYPCILLQILKRIQSLVFSLSFPSIITDGDLQIHKNY
jgi:hypothetical protein